MNLYGALQFSSFAPKTISQLPHETQRHRRLRLPGCHLGAILPGAAQGGACLWLGRRGHLARADRRHHARSACSRHAATAGFQRRLAALRHGRRNDGRGAADRSVLCHAAHRHGDGGHPGCRDPAVLDDHRPALGARAHHCSRPWRVAARRCRHHRPGRFPRGSGHRFLCGRLCRLAVQFLLGGVRQQLRQSPFAVGRLTGTHQRRLPVWRPDDAAAAARRAGAGSAAPCRLPLSGDTGLRDERIDLCRVFQAGGQHRRDQDHQRRIRRDHDRSADRHDAAWRVADRHPVLRRAVAIIAGCVLVLDPFPRRLEALPLPSAPPLV